VGFLVEYQNQGRRFVSGFSLKTTGMVCRWFRLKTTGMLCQWFVTGVIKVNDCFTLNDVTLVDRLRYNLLSISQLYDADLSVLFRKSDSHVLDSFDKHVCGISRIGNVFQANFSPAQSSLGCLIL
jgi:hypothetical protein